MELLVIVVRELKQVLYLAVKPNSRLITNTPGRNHRRLQKLFHSHTDMSVHSSTHTHTETQRHKFASTDEKISTAFLLSKHRQNTQNDGGHEKCRTLPPKGKRKLRSYEVYFPMDSQTHKQDISCNITQTCLVCPALRALK